jgi:hypothetical protein
MGKEMIDLMLDRIRKLADDCAGMPTDLASSE